MKKLKTVKLSNILAWLEEFNQIVFDVNGEIVTTDNESTQKNLSDVIDYLDNREEFLDCLDYSASELRTLHIYFGELDASEKQLLKQTLWLENQENLGMQFVDWSDGLQNHQQLAQQHVDNICRIDNVGYGYVLFDTPNGSISINYSSVGIGTDSNYVYLYVNGSNPDVEGDIEGIEYNINTGSFSDNDEDVIGEDLNKCLELLSTLSIDDLKKAFHHDFDGNYLLEESDGLQNHQQLAPQYDAQNIWYQLMSVTEQHENVILDGFGLDYPQNISDEDSGVEYIQKIINKNDELFQLGLLGDVFFWNTNNQVFVNTIHINEDGDILLGNTYDSASINFISNNEYVLSGSNETTDRREIGNSLDYIDKVINLIKGNFSFTAYEEDGSVCIGIKSIGFIAEGFDDISEEEIEGVLYLYRDFQGASVEEIEGVWGNITLLRNENGSVHVTNYNDWEETISPDSEGNGEYTQTGRQVLDYLLELTKGRTNRDNGQPDIVADLWNESVALNIETIGIDYNEYEERIQQAINNSVEEEMMVVGDFFWIGVDGIGECTTIYLEEDGSLSNEHIGQFNFDFEDLVVNEIVTHNETTERREIISSPSDFVDNILDKLVNEQEGNTENLLGVWGSWENGMNTYEVDIEYPLSDVEDRYQEDAVNLANLSENESYYPEYGNTVVIRTPKDFVNNGLETILKYIMPIIYEDNKFENPNAMLAQLLQLHPDARTRAYIKYVLDKTFLTHKLVNDEIRTEDNSDSGLVNFSMDESPNVFTESGEFGNVANLGMWLLGTYTENDFNTIFKVDVVQFAKERGFEISNVGRTDEFFSYEI